MLSDGPAAIKQVCLWEQIHCVAVADTWYDEVWLLGLPGTLQTAHTLQDTNRQQQVERALKVIRPPGRQLSARPDEGLWQAHSCAGHHQLIKLVGVGSSLLLPVCSFAKNT